MSSVNTSLSIKYNKTLKALPLCLYESIQLLARVCHSSSASPQTRVITKISYSYCDITITYIPLKPYFKDIYSVIYLISGSIG